MKCKSIFIGAIFMSFVYSSLLPAQQVAVSIKSIEVNQFISGSVSGLSPQEYKNYKIVIYVHTDQWYIHPYAGQGEGMSWAPIQPDGTWRIQTVKREFSADKVAAVLVLRENKANKKEYVPPSKVESLNIIQQLACTIKSLTGSDSGKL